MARDWPRVMKWYTRAVADSIDDDDPGPAADRAYKRNLDRIWPRLPEPMRAVSQLNLHDAWFRSNSVLESERPLEVKIAYFTDEHRGDGLLGTLLLRYHEWSLIGVDHEKAAKWLATATAILTDEIGIVNDLIEHRFLLWPGGELGFRFASVEAEFVPSEQTRQPSDEERKATPEFDPADIEPPYYFGPISAAAWCGDVEELRELLAAGGDPNEAGDDGWSAFHVACTRGQRGAVKLLLEAGAPCTDLTLLNAASEDIEIFDVLVANGCELNASTANAVIIDAAGGGNVAVVERLLAAGADPNHSDEDGDTPLQIAASLDEQAVVSVLLAAGADPRIRDEEGETAGDMAAKAGHTDVVDALRRAERPPK